MAAAAVAPATDGRHRSSPGFIKKSLRPADAGVLVDLDLLDKNIRTIAAYLKGKPVPSARIPSPTSAWKSRGCSWRRRGCAAKLGEADSLIRGGMKDVLITAPVVGHQDQAPDGSRGDGARREGGHRQRAERVDLSEPRSPPGH
jgi:hypothetical protein